MAAESAVESAEASEPAEPKRLKVEGKELHLLASPASSAAAEKLLESGQLLTLGLRLCRF